MSPLALNFGPLWLKAWFMSMEKNIHREHDGHPHG